MKKLALAISVLLASGSAFAADNQADVLMDNSNLDEVNITQESPSDAAGNAILVDLTNTYSNSIDVTQLAESNNLAVVSVSNSDENDIDVFQTASSNTTSVIADGAYNNTASLIQQNGTNNSIAVELLPADTVSNFVRIKQDGSGNNSSAFFTEADDNCLIMEMEGNDNFTDTSFSDDLTDNNFHHGTITGNENTVLASFNQSGMNELTTTALGDGNLVTVSVNDSNENILSIDQMGVLGQADVTVSAASSNNMVSVMQSNEDVSSVMLTASVGSVVTIGQN